MSSMRFPSREEVEKVRNEYPKGCRVVDRLQLTGQIF